MSDHHPAIGRLRGQNAPRQDILDRLLRVNPMYRVSWSPPSGDRPGLWEIHEFRENRLRRDAGYNRLQRWQRRWDNALPEERKHINLGIPRQCEDMMDGFHFVHACEHEEFGTDHMFHELGEGEHNLRVLKQQLDLAILKQERGEIEEEFEEDPAFAQYRRDLFYDMYDKVALGAVSEGWSPTIDRAQPGAPAAAVSATPE